MCVFVCDCVCLLIGIIFTCMYIFSETYAKHRMQDIISHDKM